MAGQGRPGTRIGRTFSRVFRLIRRNLGRIVLWLLMAVLVVMVLIWALIQSPVTIRLAMVHGLPRLNAAIPGEVRVGGWQGSLGSDLVLEELEILDDRGETAVTVARVELSWNIWDLAALDLDVHRVRLVEPKIRLELRGPGEGMNIVRAFVRPKPDGEQKKKKPARTGDGRLTVAVRDLDIVGGQVVVDLPQGEPIEVHGIELHAAHSMRKGIHDLAIRELRATPRSPVDIPEVLLSGDVQLDDLDVNLDDLFLRWQDSQLAVTGTLGPTDALAPDLKVRVVRLELEDLSAFAPKTRLAGVLEGDLTFSGKLSETLDLAGELRVDDGSSIAIEALSVGLANGDRPAMTHTLDVALSNVTPGYFLGKHGLPGDLSADIEWQGEGLTLDDLKGTLTADAEPFTYQQLDIGPTFVDATLDGPLITARASRIGLAAGEVHATGTADISLRSFDFELDGLLADLGALRGVSRGALTGGSLGFEGFARGTWGGTGPHPLSLHSQMQLDGRGLAAGPATIDELEVDFDLDLDVVKSGLPLLRGPLNLVARRVATGGTQQLTQLRVGSLLQGAAGQLQVKASRGTSMTLETRGFAEWTRLPDLSLRDDSLQILLGDQLLSTTAPFHVELADKVVGLRGLAMDVEDGRLLATAGFDLKSQGLDGEITLRELDLASIEPLLNAALDRTEEPIVLGLEGTLKDVSLDAGGSLAEPVLTVSSSLRELSFRERAPLDVDMELRSTGGLVAGHVKVTDLVTLTVGEVPATLHLDGQGPPIVLKPEGAWDVTLHLDRRNLADLEPILGMKLPLPIREGTYTGDVALEGTTAVPKIGALFSGTGIKMAERVVSLKLGGSLEDGELDLSINQLKTDVDGTIVRLTGTARSGLGALLVSRLGPPEGRSTGPVPLLSGLQLGARIESVPTALIHAFVPKAKPLTGALTGSLTVSGELNDPGFDFGAKLVGARAGRQELRPIEMVAALKDGQLTGGLSLVPRRGGRLQVLVEASVPLSLSPFRPMGEVLDQPGLQVDLRGEGFPMPVLLAFVPNVWESDGALTLSGQVTGSLLHPVPDVRLGVSDGLICYKTTGICYEEVSLDAALVPERFTLTDLSFRAVPQVVNPIDLARGRGPVPGKDASFTANGTVDLKGLKPLELDLAVNIDRMWAMYTSDIQVQLHGGLTVKGELPKLEVLGEIELQNVDVNLGQEELAARSVQPLVLPDNLVVHRDESRPGPGEQVEVVVVKSDTPKEPSLLERLKKESKVDVSIVFTNNVRVAVNYGLAGKTEFARFANIIGNVKPDLKLEGDVQILMEQGTLSLLGEIGMGRNSTLTVLTKKFQVDMDSRLTFAGAPMDTLLGLEALYPSNYGDISVLVTGQLDRPSIEFVSDELEDQADIMSVLITGKPLSEVTSAEGSGATAAIVQALAGFTTGAFGKYVPVDSLNVELGDDISSGSVEAGKAITPYIFFLARYRWGVDDDENRVEGQLEIRVTRRGYIELRIGDRLEGSVDFLGKVIF
jgi:autotransporter translocation and assembly factor TamB